MAEGQEQAEITTPLGSIKASGRDLKLILIVVTFSLVLLLAYLFWQHTQESKSDAMKLAARLEDDSKSLTGAIRDLARSQREMACVISLPMDKREREYMSQDSYCRRLSSMQ